MALLNRKTKSPKSKSGTKVGEKIASRAKVEKPKARISDYSILLSPLLTEKSSLASATGNAYLFRVDRRADKHAIKAAVERIFNVKVREVRTSNMLGKPKRTTRSLGRRAAYKKAYVSLREGETLNVVEGL